MLRIYKMPNGIKRQFDDANVPEGAVLVTKKVEEPKPEKKAEPEAKNKAVQTPKNKAMKGSKKK